MRRVLNSLGILIGLAGIAFVGRILATQWSVVVDALASADIPELLAAIVVGLLGMTQIGLGWRRALALVGVGRPVADTLYRYFVGQLGKYVPGGIWPVVGRSEMASRGGIARSSAYSSTLMSLTLTYMAAGLTALLAAPWGLGAAEAPSNRIWTVLIVPVGLLALHPRVLEALRGLASRVARRPIDIPVPAWSSSILLLLRHVPAWLAIGAATWVVADALDVSADFANILLATALSWLVGFVVIPVPGGVGVREAVFVALATSMPEALAATVAVTARLVFIAVDLIGALASTSVVGWRRRSGNA